MALKPNYQQQRSDRARSKQQKKQEKLANRRGRSDHPDAHSTELDRETGASAADPARSSDPPVKDE